MLVCCEEQLSQTFIILIGSYGVRSLLKRYSGIVTTYANCPSSNISPCKIVSQCDAFLQLTLRGSEEGFSPLSCFPAQSISFQCKLAQKMMRLQFLMEVRHCGKYAHLLSGMRDSYCI